MGNRVRGFIFILLFIKWIHFRWRVLKLHLKKTEKIIQIIFCFYDIKLKLFTITFILVC